MAVRWPLALHAALFGRGEGRKRAQLAERVTRGALTQPVAGQMLAENLPKRPGGRLVWLHVASRAQIEAVRDLVTRIEDARPGWTCLVTRDPNMDDARLECLACAPPVDRTPFVARFLSHFEPDALIWVGGRFRPLLLSAMAARRRPTIAVDAPDAELRLSHKGGWRGVLRAVLSGFDHVLVADRERLHNWQRAGAPYGVLEVRGYLETVITADEIDEDAQYELREQIGPRPLWFAAAVARDEVAITIAAHRHALRRAHRLLLVLEPAETLDPAAAEALCREAGLNTLRQSTGTAIEDSLQVLICDLPGMRPVWHHIAPSSFLGSSLVDQGGISPYAAALFGSVVVHGPHVSTHASAYARLDAAGATVAVDSADALGQAIERLLAPDYSATLAHKAWDACSHEAEAADRVLDLLITTLEARA